MQEGRKDSSASVSADPDCAPAPASSSWVLAVALGGLWWMLSGRLEAMPLVFGAFSVALVIWLARRMDVLDHEGTPVHLTVRALRYWAWLTVQICKANLDVARRVLRGRNAITPVLVRVPCAQVTDLGRALYANSITLTPGTVAVHVAQDYVDVHSLTREGAQELQDGEMGRRCTWFEGA